MPRCPDCNKFVSLDADDDPEINTLDVDYDGNVSLEARIVNKCADCGTELTEGTVEDALDLEAEFREHLKAAGLKDDCKLPADGHELSIEEGDLSRDQEGGGRYAKSYYVATVGFTVKCSCGKWTHDGEISAKIAASEMDSMV